MRGTYRPRVDMLDHASAAAVLGVTTGTVARYIARGLLAPVEPFRTAQLRLTDIEQLAASRWREGDDADGSSYLVGLGEAGRIPGLSLTRVGQLVTEGRLPFVETGRTQPPRRLYRRHQLKVIGNARRACAAHGEPSTGQR